MDKRTRHAVISSFAVDIILEEDGTQKRKGGPALFIQRVLDEMGFPYEMITGDQGVVEIDIRGDEEIGKVIEAGKISVPEDKRFNLTMISTLLDEFDLKACGKMNCLDIQGYVRERSKFRGKTFFDSPELEKFTVVKGTEEEIGRLSAERLRKVPIVMITKGSKGFSLIEDGIKRDYDASLVEVPDSIGAGDTLFAAFCVKYYETSDCDTSARFAMCFVERFLKAKSGGEI
jgi:hypothetical protein